MNEVSSNVAIGSSLDFQPSPGSFNPDTITSLGPDTFFRICADDSGTTIISCYIESFAVWLTFSVGGQSFPFMWGVTRIF